MATTALETRLELPIGARYESLIRLAESIRAQHDPTGLFRVMVAELSKVIQFDAIAQFDESANKVKWHLCDRSASSAPAPIETKKEETLAWWVYEHQLPVIIPSVQQELRFPGTIAYLRKTNLNSVCAVPLTTVHHRLGSLSIASERLDAYSAEEVRFFSLVAGHIALAMGDAINFQASQRAQERLELLLELTNRIVANLDLGDLLREISASIRRAMQCDCVGVGLPGIDDPRLHVHVLDRQGNAIVIIPEADRSPYGAACAAVYRSGEPVILNQCNEPGAQNPGPSSVCHLPLISRGRILGTMSLASSRENAFSRDDVEFVRQVAGQVAIAVENSLAYTQISDLKDKLTQEKLYLEDEIRSELNFDEIVGKSDALRRVLKQVETVAPTDSLVLIHGETGTGKELVARAVHNLSSRSGNAFVKLNCAAIPTGLLESELFGHERGAFTGAISQRIGRFELANRGTVFLDEIGEVPLELQPKLLRVLQEREFERLGSSRTLRTEARLIAATNRDLGAMVDEQRFRSDLYYRLNVFPIRIPPLRERPEDIPLLVRHFAQQFSRRMGKNIDSIPSETMNALSRYHWPGNIRELQNVIERAVILATGPVLKIPLDEIRPREAPSRLPATANRKGMRTLLDEAEREQILAALEEANWVVAGPSGAAATLGMKRSTLQSRMQKLGIRVTRSGA